MVMGPTHAMSGIAGGLLLSALVPPEWGGPDGVDESAAIGFLTAGATMLADIDSPSSTVSRSYGVVTEGIAELVNGLSAAYCNATASAQDTYRTDGHRGLTHTVWFALAAGVAVTVAVASIGLYALLAVVFVTSGLAVRGLMHEWAKKKGWIVVSGFSALVTLMMWWLIDDTRLTWLAGVSVTLGLLLHYAGDVITKNGCPILAPLRVPWSGKRWHDVSLPAPFRIRAGGLFEKTLLLPGLTVVAAGLAMWSVPGGQELILLLVGHAERLLLA